MQTPITVYTDGASSGNPGPGGYGVILKYGNHIKELSKGFRLTTNNRMELLAVIDALKAIKKTGSTIHIFTDSQYVVNAVEKRWVFNWAKTGFKKKKNPDLWQAFLALYPEFQIKFFWVRGHAGHAENERCDELAVAAARNANNIDTVYEQLGDEGF